MPRQGGTPVGLGEGAAGQVRDKDLRVGALRFRGLTAFQHGFDSRWGRHYRV